MSAIASQSAAWIAVDWGTSRLRAWAMSADHRVLATGQSDNGMARLNRQGFEPALLEVIGPWLPPVAGGGSERNRTARVPVIACGMVGSRQGWIDAPYHSVPCPPPTGAPVHAPSDDEGIRAYVVPGVKQAMPPDVMRGEETQIAGFQALNPDFDGVLCLPGTHSKWAHVSAGEIVSFQTFMTGELFALLAGDSVLRHSVAADGWDAEAFGDALSEAISRPERLAARLFSLRADALLNGLDGKTARARLSGYLLGAELAAARPYWLGQQVAVIGADDIAGIYTAALEHQGAPAIHAVGEAMTLAGLRLVQAKLKELSG